MDQVILKLLGVLQQMHEEKGVPQQQSLVDKNIVKSDKSTFDSSDKKKAGLDSSDKKTLAETFNLFNQMFFDYQKKMNPDKADKTKISGMAKSQVTAKALPPPIPGNKKDSKFGFGSILAGVLLVIGGIAAFVKGVMSNGPFKGILKLLARVGLSGGIKLLKLAAKPFIEMASKLLKFPLKIIGKIGKFLGKGVGKVFGKVFGKLGSGTLMKMVGKFLKPLAKVFKRIPIVGTIMAIAFAYSRFKNGDVVGGVIDVLSGLAGLVDIVAPGVGTAMSLGLDVLNAVLDVKADQGEGKPKKNKLTILKDMASSVGNWIWSKRMYIPILSSVNRFMMAWDDFKAGNISSGFGNFGLALSNLLTGVDGKVLMDGISGFMGLFESSGGTETAPKPNTSFISEMSSVVGDSIKKLWEWIKQKIKDGIAGMIPGGKAVMNFASNAAESTKELTKDITNKAKGAYDKSKSFISGLWGKLDVGSINGKAKELYGKGQKFYDDTYKKLSIDSQKSMNVPSGVKSDLRSTIDNMKDRKSDTTMSRDKAFYKIHSQSNLYLKIIANNTATLARNMGSGNGGGGSTTVITSPQQAPQTQKVSMGNNRAGFSTSAYALG